MIRLLLATPGNRIPPDPPIVARYRERLPPGCTIAAATAGAGSAQFTALAEVYRRNHGSVLAGVRAAAGWQPGDLLALAVYSAAYGLARELLREDGSPAHLDALVTLDSVHAAEPRPGVPQADQVAPFARYAARAVAGQCVLIMGASDVDPVSYASTREVVRAVADAVGVIVRPVVGRAPCVAEGARGALRLRHYDADPSGAGMAEHGRALTVWGPTVVAEVCRLLAELTAGGIEAVAPTEPAPPSVGLGDEPWRRPAPARCEPARRARLVDVSRYQGPGDGNAWARWRAEKGIVGGFARCASGGVRDATYAANARGMLDADLVLRGAYAWHDPRRSVADHLAAIGELVPGTIFAIDVEPWPNAQDPKGALRTWASATRPGDLVEIVERVRERTRAPALCYTAGWAWRWGDALASRDVGLWVADASGLALRSRRPAHAVPGWDLEQWLVWQTGTAPLPGEPAAVDSDVWCGDEASLGAWVRG